MRTDACFAYRYGLRRCDEVIATGHMTREGSLDVGERIKIDANEGIVRSIEPILGEAELHLVALLRERTSTRSYTRAKYVRRR